MGNKIKDTDYLAISARIRAMENGVLTCERMEQILEARTNDDVTKILQECGYPRLDPTNPEEMDAAFSSMRETVLQDLADGVPDLRYIEIFKLKYDYHNVKVILKSEAMGISPDHMLMNLGRIAATEIKTAVQSGNTGDLPTCLAAAVAEGSEVLNTTRDPQLSDIVVDRRWYAEMVDIADATGSEFLKGFVKIRIDAENLRSLIRAIRMGKNADFLRGVLISGGDMEEESMLKICESSGNSLAEFYASTYFQSAAEMGEAALRGAPLTEFEKLCDDAVTDYLGKARMIPFGEAPLLAYLAAKETEYINLRVLLMGRKAGVKPDVIRSRLRQSYV